LNHLTLPLSMLLSLCKGVRHRSNIRFIPRSMGVLPMLRSYTRSRHRLFVSLFFG